MTSLVLAEHDNASIKAATLSAILQRGSTGPVRDELIAALAGTRDPAGAAMLVRLLPALNLTRPQAEEGIAAIERVVKSVAG